MFPLKLPTLKEWYTDTGTYSTHNTSFMIFENSISETLQLSHIQYIQN
jgi:hypothetical protein